MVRGHYFHVFTATVLRNFRTKNKGMITVMGSVPKSVITRL